MKKTACAIRHRAYLKKCQTTEDTTVFIKKFTKWSKTSNVKEKGMDMRKLDPIQAVISDMKDERLNYIISMGNMGFKIVGGQGRRVKQLSRDTTTAFHHT